MDKSRSPKWRALPNSDGMLLESELFDKYSLSSFCNWQWPSIPNFLLFLIFFAKTMQENCEILFKIMISNIWSFFTHIYMYACMHRCIYVCMYNQPSRMVIGNCFSHENRVQETQEKPKFDSCPSLGWI